MYLRDDLVIINEKFTTRESINDATNFTFKFIFVRSTFDFIFICFVISSSLGDLLHYKGSK